ncbi:MAG TPA: glycosyltransferase family 1 protein [Anaerolineae bacterium]|nr:glycosyltransferase family 1 protein [Anaerolineae bacterium]
MINRKPSSSAALIGIDASRSIGDRPTGTELYSRYLIETLIDQTHPDYSFRLYYNQPPKSLSPNPRSAIRIIPFPRLWTHVRLSLEMLLHAPDLLFIPAHVIPIIHPRRSIVTVHDLGYLHFPEAHPPRQRWYLDRSTRWNVRSASRAIADSEATKRDLIDRYHAEADRISVAYPGIDPSIQRVADPIEIDRVKAKYNIDDDYILYLGTLQPRKNLSRMITAFGQVQSNLQLVLAGKTGWYADPLFKQVADHSLSARVLFPGYTAEADKSALLSGATALVFPSLYEGFGFPVLEAMRCGVPVLCSNTSSLPEVSGDAALLIDPLSIESIADGLTRIINDQALRQKLIAAGYAQAKKFSWRSCADDVLKVIQQVLNS